MRPSASQALKLLLLEDRSSLGCNPRGISPISSRNKVPVSAISKRPILCATAPVKAPFSCPKSSLSNRSKGMAEQLTFTNGCPQCELMLWMARDEFLPGACFPKDEHRGISGCHSLHFGEHEF